MARLAFFSERLPSADRLNARTEEITAFSYDLMLSLADQQHDVRVFSTYRDDDLLPASHPRLQILRPFRRWSWLELPRLMPILLDFQPEILHFIQPRNEAFSGLTNAMTALPTLAPLIGRPRVVLSLYDVRRDQLQKNRSLLSMAETIIVANRQQADEVAAWFTDKTRQPAIEVVPLPAPESAVSNEREVLPGLDQLRSLAADLILIPGDLDHQRDLDAVAIALDEILSLNPTCGVVIGGGWGSVSIQRRRAFLRTLEDRGHGPRILLTGPLTPAGERTCLQAAALVLLAGLNASSLPQSRWIRLSLQNSRPLILSETQCRLDPLTWRHLENSFVVPDDPRSWAPVVAAAVTNPGLLAEVRKRLPEFARSEAVDHPGNSVSRIYAQVLRSPRKPLR